MKTSVISAERDEQQAGQRARQLERLALALAARAARVKTGTKALRERRVGDQRADQVRDLEGERERRRGAAGAEVAARRRSRGPGPRCARGPSPTEKIAVLHRRAARGGGASGEAKRRAIVRGRRGIYRGLLHHGQHQSQIKRNSRSQRERFENRHYTSQIKTYFRRLETAVDRRRRRAADAEHRKLVSLIDKAVKRGALHAQHRRAQEVPRRAPAPQRPGRLDPFGQPSFTPAPRPGVLRSRSGRKASAVGSCADSGWMPFGELLVGADHVHHGVDQRQVGERLREVAQVPAAARVDLLRVQVQRRRVAEQLLAQVAGQRVLADLAQRADEPERADRERPLLAVQPVVGLLDACSAARGRRPSGCRRSPAPSCARARRRPAGSARAGSAARWRPARRSRSAA